MFKRLKNTKSLKLVIGTIIAAIGGMILPETNELHLSLLEGVQTVVLSFGLLFMRDGVAKS